MPDPIVRDYARLLTEDTDRCAALFAEDAELLTRMGNRPVHLRGREEIRGFIANVPRWLTFDVRRVEPVEGGHRAEIAISGKGFGPVHDVWRCETADDGLIRRIVVESEVDV